MGTAWGWPPDGTPGLRPGGPALTVGGLMGLVAYGQAQRGRAGTQRPQVLRDFMALPKPWVGVGVGAITATVSDQELERKELTNKKKSFFLLYRFCPDPEA